MNTKTLISSHDRRSAPLFEFGIIAYLLRRPLLPLLPTLLVPAVALPWITGAPAKERWWWVLTGMIEVLPASTPCRDRTAPAHPVPALGTNPSTTPALQAQISDATRHRSETILLSTYRTRGSTPARCVNTTDTLPQTSATPAAHTHMLSLLSC